jgi:putative hydrolase of the HAD superfamily
MIKALLFDLYDTLATIDAGLYLNVKEEMAAKAAIPADQFLKVWKSYTKPSALGELLTLEERVARVMRDLNVRPEPQVVRDIALLEYKLQTEEVHLSDGVVEMLDHFQKSGFTLGLVTNAPNYMRGVPAILGIEQYFDTVIFSFDLRVLKPDARIYQAACRNLKVEPSECMFIGDGNDRELDGAQRLGIIAVQVGEGRSEILRGEQSQTCDYRLRKIAALKELVSKLRADS